MPVTKEDYGVTSHHRVVHRFTVTNGNGMIARLITYGASLTELWVPDRHGQVSDVVLGWQDLKGYEKNECYLGVTVGRVVNRIAGGQFSLDGADYHLDVNMPPNHIHGGNMGFSHRVWDAVIDEVNNAVTFSYTSGDGEEGYPGEIPVSVTYQLDEENKLLISYLVMSTTKATPINLSNHSYFNLAGHSAGNVLDHCIQINADEYLPMNLETSLPTGEIADVATTVFDLRRPTRLGDRVSEVLGQGYDHNFCLKPDEAEGPCAIVTHEGSGRRMKVSTTSPGIQLYTANNLTDSVIGKGGARYPKHSALCLECQHYPNAINQPNFPSCILRPGEQYLQLSAYAFSRVS